RDLIVTGVQTCALPISTAGGRLTEIVVATAPVVAAGQSVPAVSETTRRRNARPAAPGIGDARLIIRIIGVSGSKARRGRHRVARSEERRVGKEGGARWE